MCILQLQARMNKKRKKKEDTRRRKKKEEENSNIAIASCVNEFVVQQDE
jgi:hypothetical protein